MTLKTIFHFRLPAACTPTASPMSKSGCAKTALMSEANAAYDRKDLVALMNIQLQAEMVDRDHASRLSAERLAALTLLLKQQAAELERERQMAQQHWMRKLNIALWPVVAARHAALLAERTLSGYNERLTR